MIKHSATNLPNLRGGFFSYILSISFESPFCSSLLSCHANQSHKKLMKLRINILIQIQHVNMHHFTVIILFLFSYFDRSSQNTWLDKQCQKLPFSHRLIQATSISPFIDLFNNLSKRYIRCRNKNNNLLISMTKQLKITNLTCNIRVTLRLS